MFQSIQNITANDVSNLVHALQWTFESCDAYEGQDHVALAIDCSNAFPVIMIACKNKPVRKVYFDEEDDLWRMTDLTEDNVDGPMLLMVQGSS